MSIQGDLLDIFALLKIEIQVNEKKRKENVVLLEQFQQDRKYLKICYLGKPDMQKLPSSAACSVMWEIHRPCMFFFFSFLNENTDHYTQLSFTRLSCCGVRKDHSFLLP